MKMFLYNLLLAFGWMMLVGHFSPLDLLIGFVLSYFVLRMLGHRIGESTEYFHKAPKAIEFFFFFLKELILANVRVAHDVVTPAHRMRPGIIAVPLDARTDEEIALLANLITLTPGSMSLDVSPDRRYLYVHLMYVDDLDESRQEIKRGFERRTLELLR